MRSGISSKFFDRLLLGGIAVRRVDATYCYKPSGMVYQSVCRFVTEVSPAKMAEAIKTPFGLRMGKTQAIMF